MVLEDGKAWVRTEGGTQTVEIYKDGGARVGKSEGDYRGRLGMGNDGRG